ncbi:DUF1295 domain-containing protein [bacterium]|nr:DUF1295 domain-containing protein [bacterium]
MKLLLCVLFGWVVMSVAMTLLWWVQYRRHNAGIVDVAGSLGVGLLGVLFAWQGDGAPTRRLLLAGMISIWALRLSVHLVRRIGGEREDGRYRRLRGRWGDRAQPYLFVLFQVQASWSVLFALPLLLAARNPSPLGMLDLLAVVIWIVALAGESLADFQLARFRRDPANRGKVCRDGLWYTSRHPNYFFEWVHWWAYVCMGWGAPLGWLTLAGPILMLFFLFKITGIPPTEEQALASRGEDYRRYQASTSAFFPWPPKEKENRS